jgi:hypothetical protein
MGVRILCGTLIIVLGLSTLLGDANAADRPVVEAVVDHDSDAVLWSSANSTAAMALNRVKRSC